jgi:GDP-D-mannose dehydratase
MEKCLITGCEGFVGSHLADLSLEKGLPVYGMVYLVISRLLPSYF